MVYIEEKNLLVERVLQTEWDYEIYNFDIEQAIYLIEQFYNFTKSGIEYNLLMKKGYYNERSKNGDIGSYVKVKYFDPTSYNGELEGEYLIQIVDEGVILFSERYNAFPSKKELIEQLNNLKREYIYSHYTLEKLEYYKTLSDEEIIKIMDENMEELKYVENPSYKVQRYAVEKDFKNIHYINPRALNEIRDDKALTGGRLYQGFVGLE